MPLCFNCGNDLSGYIIEIFRVDGRNMGMVKGSPGRPVFRSHNAKQKTGEIDWETYRPVAYECPYCQTQTKMLNQLINWSGAGARKPASARS